VENNYSYWKVLRAQWSWNNDKFTLLFAVVVSLFLVGVVHFTGIVYVGSIEEYIKELFVILLVQMVSWLLLYYTLKVLLLGSCVMLVCKWVKDGDCNAKRIYKEILTWRQ
jgi:hypothetical protein